MPRYTVVSGQHRTKTGRMVKAGRSFFSPTEGLDRGAFEGKIKLADESPKRKVKSKKSRRAQRAEEEAIEEEEAELSAASRKKSKKDKKKGKKGKGKKKGKKSKRNE
jgi:hypothetical protein